MQIKEFQAFTLKDCLQQVRDDLGAEAVILETRKFRKGGVLGWGTREAVCIVAATGITVKDDLKARNGAATPASARTDEASRARNAAVASGNGMRQERGTGGGTAERIATNDRANARTHETKEWAEDRALHTDAEALVSAGGARRASAQNAARTAYGRPEAATPRAAFMEESAPNPKATTRLDDRAPLASQVASQEAHGRRDRADNFPPPVTDRVAAARERLQPQPEPPRPAAARDADEEPTRMASLEAAMREIRDCLALMQREQKESSERTVSAVVSAVAPAVSAFSTVTQLTGMADDVTPRFADLRDKLLASGVSDSLTAELLDELPDLSAWSDEAQMPLAVSTLRDLIGRRVRCAGPIALTPGKLKAVALIGPTGVGKTTTIAKLAAHFALAENKKVALLTVDTYRIAAVEQLKIYSQILDIPIGVAYSQAEVLPVVAQYADYDLLLIDTAGRSQKNIMQVGELKSLLESLDCETHLVMSAQTKEQDMIEASRRFSAARVDSLLFTKLDETDSYGTLLNVADKVGIPLSYVTTGQKVPEDIESATGALLANLLLD